MAKGAANEDRMGGLHAQVARVFEKVLINYEKKLDVEDDEEMGMVEVANPAMMGAITKFLKDNSIGLDTEEVEKLSATAERLIERKGKRAKLANLTSLTLVEANG